MRYTLLNVTPQNGQWKWKKDVAMEAVENYRQYLELYSSKQSLEDYWTETGKIKRFIRRKPNGKGVNQGVEHWIPPSEGVLRSTDWTDILASSSVSTFDVPISKSEKCGCDWSIDSVVHRRARCDS